MRAAVFWNIHKLSFWLEKQVDEVLKTELSIGFAQYKVLEAINQNTLAQQNVIATLLDQTEASISRQIRILESKGLIEVHKVMGNKRARELVLTIQGDELVSQANTLLEATVAQAIDKLKIPEQKYLLEIIARMMH